MMRRCDGTDPNLTRQVPEAEFMASRPVMTANVAWKRIAQPGMIVINCQCGQSFDDMTHLVVYPHDPLPPKLTDEQLAQAVAMLDEP